MLSALLDDLQPTVLLSHQTHRWLKSSVKMRPKMRPVSAVPLQLKKASLVNRLPFIRQPGVDLEHQVSFTDLVNMTLICFLGSLQRQASENQACAWEDELPEKYASVLC